MRVERRSMAELLRVVLSPNPGQTPVLTLPVGL